ncbi:MAG: hypothetical protein RL497_2335 [Pseudomonadota bacterium]|jgi:hypothetical protein
MKIAICFFGIPRSLYKTLLSIEKNVIAPAQKLGEVKIFAHFFNQREIFNPRSGESGALLPDQHTLLKTDWLLLEEPEQRECVVQFGRLKSYGDIWNDNFQSLRNLTHQLYSLNSVSQAALEWNPNLYVFVRPDLMYHDSLEMPMIQMLDNLSDVICIPNWQHWGGFNDRFSICASANAAKAYGGRKSQAENYCIHYQRPLHSESLVKYALKTQQINVVPMSARASRVRSNGVVKVELFEVDAWALNIRN